MRWSFPIGTIAGIRVELHVTFVLFLAYLALSAGLLTGHPARALTFVALVLLVFLCVLLHELGHAFAARRYGIRTRDIILLPIGGVARLQRMPDNVPWIEAQTGVRYETLRKHYAAWMPQAHRGVWTRLDCVREAGPSDTIAANS